MFKTSKCNHGDKGMCINCLVNKQKQINNNPTLQKQKKNAIGCMHPPHMKCLKCLPEQDKFKSLCQHPDYRKCQHCQHLIQYQTFSQYLETLEINCVHKKPCSKCVPPLSRKNYFIDKFCKKHLPYPQAQCDSCMAPTLTIGPQKYSHVRKVVIKTTSVYRVADSQLFGILLGRVKDDVVEVEDVYFPSEQQLGSNYINPDFLQNMGHIWEYLNLKEVGLLYHSESITGLGLMISSLFQQKFLTLEGEHQISKFITMRLELEQPGKEIGDPHFQCFMVSDQLQAFHKHGLIYEKETHDNYFDLITTKSESTSEMPTFLRGGMETDRFFFKEVLVWVETASEENFFDEGSHIPYPFFTLDRPSIEDMKKMVELQVDPLEKYRNIQFLLHLSRLIGREGMAWFINNYLPFDPDLFLREKLTILQKIEDQKLRLMQNQKMYQEGE